MRRPAGSRVTAHTDTRLSSGRSVLTAGGPCAAAEAAAEVPICTGAVGIARAAGQAADGAAPPATSPATRSPRNLRRQHLRCASCRGGVSACARDPVLQAAQGVHVVVLVRERGFRNSGAPRAWVSAGPAAEVQRRAGSQGAACMRSRFSFPQPPTLGQLAGGSWQVPRRPSASSPTALLTGTPILSLPLPIACGLLASPAACTRFSAHCGHLARAAHPHSHSPSGAHRMPGTRKLTMRRMLAAIAALVMLATAAAAPTPTPQIVVVGRTWPGPGADGALHLPQASKGAHARELVAGPLAQGCLPVRDVAVSWPGVANQPSATTPTTRPAAALLARHRCVGQLCRLRLRHRDAGCHAGGPAANIPDHGGTADWAALLVGQL